MYPLFLVLFFAASSMAQTTWKGNDPNWVNPNNWTNGIPGPGNDATIPANPTGGLFPAIFFPVTIDYNLQNFGEFLILPGGNVQLTGILTNEQSGLINSFGIIGGTGNIFNFGSYANFSNGSLEIAFGGIFNNANGAMFNNLGNIEVQGNFSTGFTMNNNFGGSIHVLGGGLFDVLGAINNTGGLIEISNGSTFNVNVGAGLTNTGGTINNSGAFISNGPITNVGIFNNTFSGFVEIFSSFTNDGGAQLSNAGFFQNSDAFYNNAGVENSGFWESNAHFNNNGFFTSLGVFVVKPGTVFDNQLSLSNTGNSFFVDGTFNNFSQVNNGGNIKVSVIGQVANNDYILNNSNGTIENNGIINNVQCAIIKNDNLIQNFTTILNSGIIYNNGNIAPSPPIAVGSGMVTMPGSPAGLCEDISVQLDDANPFHDISVMDLTGPIFDFCNNGWTFTVNGAPNIFIGCGNLGLTSVFLNIMDPYGNISNCTSNITTTDIAPPMISCNNSSIQMDASGNASITPWDVLGSSSDNCNFVNPISVVPNTFTCLMTGPNTITLTAVDGSGNVGTCTGQIEVIDFMPPTVTCQDKVVELDNFGQAFLAPLDIIVSSADNCGILNSVLSKSDFDCDDIGTIQITAHVFDFSGNPGSCTANVTVQDNIMPIVSCPGNVSTTPNPGVCIADVYLPDPFIIYDNCGIMEISNNAPPQFNLGLTVVTWNVIDKGGSVTNCIQTVTITDLEPPMLICPPNVTINTDPGSCGAFTNQIINTQPVVTDNCGLGTTFHNAPPFMDAGMNTITWTALDWYGNIGFCEQTVFVADKEAPTFFNCPIDIVADVSSEDCGAYADWIPPFVGDNCELVSNTSNYEPGDFLSLGNNLVTYIATDENYNTTLCEFTVTVVDNVAPEFVYCPLDIEIIAEDCGQVVYAYWDFPEIEEPCIDYIYTNGWYPGDQFPTGTTVVSYEAADLSGNSSTCSFEIRVKDALEIICIENLQVSVEQGAETANVSWNFPVTQSDCDMCPEEDLPGFQFIGHYQGHQYYLYTENKVPWGWGQDIAEAFNGHLISINDQAENDFIQAAMPPESAVWIGLNDAFFETDWVWANEDEFDYANWQNGSAPGINFTYNYVLMYHTGVWAQEHIWGEHHFVMEVPCYDTERNDGEADFTNGGEFPVGITTLSYESVDQCGNRCTCSFDIEVIEAETVEYCTTAGLGDVFISKVIIGEFENESGDDSGYADFTDQMIIATVQDCYFELTPFGNTADEILFWRIWIDVNMDGDFFDEGELIFETSGPGVIAELHSLVDGFPIDPARLRIAMSRSHYPEVCGTYHDGEVEDYTIFFNDSDFDNSEDEDKSCGIAIKKFETQAQGQHIQIHWLIEENEEADHFVIEKSIDGIDFENLAILQAIGNGNKIEIYQANDEEPVKGKNYYRLKAYDKNDCESISEVSTIKYNQDLADFFVYPNPAVKQLFVNAEPFEGKAAQIRIYNSIGQTMYEKEFDSMTGNPLPVDVSKYTNGTYFIYVKAEGLKHKTIQFVVENYGEAPSY